MTGFGRTGRWFGLDHWGVRPDLLVAAKGATSGYWPFGFVAASDAVYETVTAPGAGFVHGFTYSHAPVGAAVAREVLRILHDERPGRGERRRRASGSSALLRDRARRTTRRVGEIRGRGLLVGLELVADRETRRPYPRAARVTEAVVAAARRRGVLVYSGTGNADGTDGDTILLGPPFVVTDDELVRIADVLAEAVSEAVDGSIVAADGRRRGVPARRGAAGSATPAGSPERAAEHQHGPERDQHERHDQPADLRREHVHAAEQRQQSAEPGLPADPATGRRPDRGDEQERDPEAERAQPLEVDARRR